MCSYTEDYFSPPSTSRSARNEDPPNLIQFRRSREQSDALLVLKRSGRTLDHRLRDFSAVLAVDAESFVS